MSLDLQYLKNKNVTFTFQLLPKNLTELQLLPEASLDSPYATAALAVAAMCYYGSDPSKVVDMLNYLKGPSSLSQHDIQFMRDRLKGKEFKTFSFFEGALPGNNYTPSEPYRITVSDNPNSWIVEDTSSSATGPVHYARLYIKSSGADSARPITMRYKPSTNQWFMTDHQLLADIRVPIAEDKWS